MLFLIYILFASSPSLCQNSEYEEVLQNLYAFILEKPIYNFLFSKSLIFNEKDRWMLSYMAGIILGIVVQEK